jgi:integrase
MRSAIKRDGLMLALYTGLRRDDVRTMRFDQVDFDNRPCTYRTRREAPARRSRPAVEHAARDPAPP